MRAWKTDVRTGYYDEVLQACDQLIERAHEDRTAEEAERARAKFYARLLDAARRSEHS